MAEHDLLQKMRSDWDRRAQVNLRHYILDCREHWTEDEFLQSGEVSVQELILTDMEDICQGMDPREMRVLEIGCGAGRVTRALARLFGEVHGVDVSGEMIAEASRVLAGLPNAHVYQNNGMDLEVLGVGELTFDFAFSMCVFHHIPSKAIIESYISEVGKRLRPDRLFKFEVQGYLGLDQHGDDTWLGAPLSEREMTEIAARSGFEARYSTGAGEERYWHWFYKVGSRVIEAR